MRTALLVLCLAGQVHAGMVTGTVPLEGRVPAKSEFADACFWRLGQHRDRQDAPVAVVLEGTNNPKPKAAGITIKVRIEGYGFNPNFLAVPTDATLVFENLDARSYSCFADGQQAFQFSELKPGGTHEQRLLSTGLVGLRCHLYPFMRSSILVVDSPLVTVADAEGKFTFKDVPAGNYQVKVFTSGAWREAQNVTVAAAGLTKVDFNAAGTPSEPAQPAQAEPEKTVGAPEPPAPAEKKPEPTPTPAPTPAPVKPPPVAKQPPEKKPPVAKPKPKKDAEPVFKDVEPEIEIEEE